ncbi:hypothetical protein GUITHDRAFT_97019 [Guillardia theta CCMP2712]|uniref:Aminoglycoside phosphotransferase domain-containing protein n=1 Tax=Guillardia theta (strain CCMP2712) TaxID=905079 RepID=L1IQY9_GUITC|nr:hypothetical protein GUITHDRAFT_97019 [Guillardia theta CCMP2712]EKX38274.1 hypothetical protein GUITHDRAFT_97019 [Guillardia theta CCMP2712]|eukprot:XP_005825254.1 hypothetical protein GUITHDRAFT_97019 [Guillardia theta CCMP2712]
MAQTFTEADTWKATDIPKLLKEAATHFLDDDNVKFTPTSGGVNNLVQYVDTSDGQRYVMRIYNNGGNSVRVKYEHAVLKELNKQTMSFKVPDYVPSKKTGDTHVLLSNGAEACMCHTIPGELPKSAEPASIGRAAGELLVALGNVKIELKSPTPPYFDIYKVHHAISREKFFEEIQKPWADSCKESMNIMVQEFERIEKRLEELKSQNLPFQLIHGDLHFDNVLYDGKKVTGLLDFEFAAEDWRAMELAVCLSKYAAEKDPFNLMDSFVSGFCEYGELTRKEVEGIPDMINLRIMSNVLYFIGRALAKEDTIEALTSRADMYAERIQWVNANRQAIIKSLSSPIEKKLADKAWKL